MFPNHIEKNAPPTGGHVFSPIWTIFKLVRDINKTNVLTNFHDDWAKIVTSIVKTAPPPTAMLIQLIERVFWEKCVECTVPMYGRTRATERRTDGRTDRQMDKNGICGNLSVTLLEYTQLKVSLRKSFFGPTTDRQTDGLTVQLLYATLPLKNDQTDGQIDGLTDERMD
ncbi:hypothetical protein DPMN_000731 [Dreissena polymorpha]|uniref:Uncharacterized protein n=1 Tax=Dreissena polymorpha TaxID=45954 RepID=A0A9D4MIQ6_DREPO|nr:hypothetical protein DPMN_000731 [Dreissena polymorpha]